MDGGIVGNMVAWFQEPFNTKGSALNWVLFVGLLILAAFLWQLVLLELFRD